MFRVLMCAIPVQGFERRGAQRQRPLLLVGGQVQVLRRLDPLPLVLPALQRAHPADEGEQPCIYEALLCHEEEGHSHDQQQYGSDMWSTAQPSQQGNSYGPASDVTVESVEQVPC